MDAAQQMMPLLTGSEADALLAINDGMTRAFVERWEGNPHPHPQLEASRFLISIAITQEQVEAALKRGADALR